jgi:hypothetical protein
MAGEERRPRCRRRWLDGRGTGAFAVVDHGPGGVEPPMEERGSSGVPAGAARRRLIVP